MPPTFSVITPTYNRRHTLSNAYGALLAQTFRDFEWIVVDDGSTDGTADLVPQWNSDFPIVYRRQANAGKPSAVNAGLREARGSYVVVLDDDDLAVPEALAVFVEVFRDAPPEIGLVGTLTMSSSGKINGSRLDADTVDMSHLDAYARHGVTGDKWLAFRAEVAKAFPYPVFGGERFVSEGIVFNRMSRAGHKVRYVNRPLLVHDYLSDGLTRNHLRLKANNPLGFIAYHMENLSDRDAALSPYYLKSAANYYAVLLSGARRPLITALLLIAAMPIGIAKAVLDRSRLRRAAARTANTAGGRTR